MGNSGLYLVKCFGDGKGAFRLGCARVYKHEVRNDSLVTSEDSERNVTTSGTNTVLLSSKHVI